MTGRSGDRAGRHRATVPRIAPARRPASSPVALALPGTGSVPRPEENVAAGGITLTEEDLADLARATVSG